MKTLITSTYATNASSNFGPNWQRDHDYFVSAATKPTIYQALANRFQTMWNDSTGFGPLRLTPPNPATLVSPASGATGVATTSSLVWNRAAWAVSYDVYLGTSPSSMSLVGNVPAQMVVNPPDTYSFTPATLVASATLLLDHRVADERDATQSVDGRQFLDRVVYDRGFGGLRRDTAGAVDVADSAPSDWREARRSRTGRSPWRARAATSGARPIRFASSRRL